MLPVSQMVEQAYCFSSDNMGFRFQIINGSAYIAGEAGEWQVRVQQALDVLVGCWLMVTAP